MNSPVDRPPRLRVHRLLEHRNLIGPIKGRASPDIAIQVSRAELEARIVAPLIRIADEHLHAGKLIERLAPGARAHPTCGRNPDGRRALELLNHVLDANFGGVWEVASDIVPANGIAETEVHLSDRELPPWDHRTLPKEVAAAKNKPRFDEAAGKIRTSVIDRAKRLPGFQGVERSLGDDPCDFADGRFLGKHDPRDVRGA